MADPPESSRAIPLQPMKQDSASTNSASRKSTDTDAACTYPVTTGWPDLEAETSVTGEDSADSDSECLSHDEEENELESHDLSYLCERCRELDFDSIFSRTNTKGRCDPIHWFDSEREVPDDEPCSFCQAIRFIHPSLDILPQWKKRTACLAVATFQEIARGESGWDATGDRVCLTIGHQEAPSPVFGLFLWTKKVIESKFWRNHYYLENEWVGYLAERQTIEANLDAFPAASIKSRVNFGMIKEMLKECREQHPECRSKPGGYMKEIPGMRLIDCRTQSIVPAPDGNVSYAALSYVWGDCGDSELGNGFIVEDDSTKLPDPLPNTISDAILVTRKLKIRYLWIDRYCIRQTAESKEEKDEKHGQIAQMHHIYGGASITIIAAAGQGPHHGLPGVRTKRRSPAVRLPNRTLFATLPDPKLLVDASTWSTRGWTFQEGLLARRLLVFTNQQVYFQCGEKGHTEAWEKYKEERTFRTSLVRETPPLYPYFALGDGGRPSVWPRISHYVKLAMRDPQDILNGILGILTHYERISDMRHITGLPIDPRTALPISWSQELTRALSWQCNDPGERRAGFPTWSWTGWTCKGFEKNEKVNQGFADAVRPWSISVERPSDESIDQGDLVALLDGDHDLSQIMFLRVTARSLEAEIISMRGIPEGKQSRAGYYVWGESGFDNHGKSLCVRYSGVEEVSLINLTDSNWLKSPLPCGKIQCFAIIIDEDLRGIPNDQSTEGMIQSIARFTRHPHATALLVIEKEDGFERIGVSGIDPRTLRRAGSIVRTFRLM